VKRGAPRRDTVKLPASGHDARQAAHDFNNLLTAIIGTTDSILQRTRVDPERRADVAHIREGARRGAMLVRRLRGETRAAPELVRVDEAIRATCRLLEHRLGATIALALELTDPDGQVIADIAQLDRALLNLIVNARHAMPNGGTVTLGTRRQVLTDAEIRTPDTIPAGDYVVIAVADSGGGIPADRMSRIFAAGFTSRRRSGGSGLGLSSVRDIVREANGFLSVHSVEGLGTRFEIYLPRAEHASPPALTPAETPALAQHSVLLVEDDLTVRRVAERAMRRAGWTVLCADSAEDALEILRRSRCDLMISDIALPGMDGVALARLVARAQPELPVILTSGYARSATDDAIANVVFLTKPYGHAELLATAVKAVGDRADDADPDRR